MAIGGSKLGDLIGVGPAYNGQFNCTPLVFEGLHACAGGNDLDGNIWITSNPAVQSPIDLPKRNLPADRLVDRPFGSVNRRCDPSTPTITDFECGWFMLAPD